MSKKGSLQVNTENIFPIIKKFLYSDHEIFLRELVSNAVDATQKMKMLAQKGEFAGELGDLTIRVSIDKENKTLTVSDAGIGMTEDEIERYINQIAFSSAEEFIEKFKDIEDKGAIIGHFGLGFYSAFMVANHVELKSQSYKEEGGVHWSCTGTIDFELSELEKANRGTDVVLHVNDENNEFLESHRMKNLLEKYCKYMPIAIEFDGNVINTTDPLWLKQPAEIKDEEYNEFYKQMFPFHADPLFHIHLNVDYPFNLTGILYFPKIENNLTLDKNKIHLYSNQVFVTDSVNEIVPEFLTLLHGVIDSPDIPLNVSRSYLQADGNVKKISNYIVKKVADKLESIFKNDRAVFEEKWQDISIFVKYGMLTDEKFMERAKKFFLMKSTDNKLTTLEEYKEKVKATQTDKDGKLVYLYTHNAEVHDSFIQSANERGYDVLLFDHPIDSHLLQRIEMNDEDIKIKRIDAAPISELIETGIVNDSVLSTTDIEVLEATFKKRADDKMYKVENKALSPQDPPLVITQDEFMRRMKEMSAMNGGGMMGMGSFPDSFNLIINTNHPLNKKLVSLPEEARDLLAMNAFDLARLSSGMLKGADLSRFVKRSIESLD